MLISSLFVEWMRIEQATIPLSHVMTEVGS